MASTTGWIGGRGQGIGTWGTAINGADMQSLASGSSVMSSVADIANGGTVLDMYADVSIRIIGVTGTPQAGSYVAIFLVPVLADGTYGDGQFASGTSKAAVPVYSPAGIAPLQNVALPTTGSTGISGFIQGILLPPGSFRFLIYNFSTIAFSSTAGNNVVTYRTYNINLNA